MLPARLVLPLGGNQATDYIGGDGGPRTLPIFHARVVLDWTRPKEERQEYPVLSLGDVKRMGRLQWNQIASKDEAVCCDIAYLGNLF